MVAALAAAVALAAAAPLLPREVGLARLGASLAAYVTFFLIAWFVTPGGLGAARELLLAIREMRLRITG
jgi:hypothetical protein